MMIGMNGYFLTIPLFAIAIAYGAYSYHGHVVGKLEQQCRVQTERAETAESDLATAKADLASLKTAMQLQEQALQAAQAKRKVIYRSVQKEVATDETVRGWYGTPVPDSLVRVLQGNGTKND